MSWFDASKFSNYAKTALKHAQKNIDKVLDIGDDDANTSKFTNTNSGGTAPTQLISSPKSPTYVAKESDSFFETFLGSDIKKQVSNYLTPQTNSIASIEVSSNDAVDTSQRKGRLKDRSIQNVGQTDVSTPDLLKSNTIEDDNLLTSGKSNKKECQDIHPSITIEYNSSSTEIIGNNSFAIVKDDLFDDIDLTDSDIDIADDISDITDDNEICTTAVQSLSSTKGNKFESLDEDGDEEDGLLVKYDISNDNLDCIKDVPVNSEDILTTHIGDIFVSSNQDVVENSEIITHKENVILNNNGTESENIPCDENILPVDNSITLDTLTTKEESIVLLVNESLGNEINFDTTDQLTKDEDNDISIKTDKLIDNVNDYISENNDVGIKLEELGNTSNDETPENKPILSGEVENKSIDIRYNDSFVEGNDIVVKTEEVIDIANDCTPENNDTVIAELPNKAIDIRDDGISESNIVVKTEELDVANAYTDENKDILPCELPNKSIDISNKTLECNDIIVKTDVVDITTDITTELPSTLDQNVDGLENLNQEILTEFEPAESYGELVVVADDSYDKVLESNKIHSNLVKKESNENQTENASEFKNKGLKKVSFAIDCISSDAALIQNDVTDTNKILQSNDSLVHVDIPKSDSSSLCIVKQSEYDQLEMIMQRTEYELITASETEVSVDILNKDVLQQSNLLENSIRKCYIEDNASEVHASSHIIAPLENEINLQQSEEVNQLNEKIADLNKEVKELRNIIDAREMKMVELSKQNITFQESLSVYQSQINQLEEVNKCDDEEMENMRQEFTKRIAESDSKYQAAVKERDHCKAKSIETEASIRQSANEQVSLLTNSLLEKEETIQDLLNEGEALSKKELESNTRIKKLRMKLKEVTTNNTALTEQISGFESEIQKLKDVIKEKENNENRLEVELKKLEGITDSQEDEVSALKEQLDDMEERYKTMESTLHNTYSEINRLNLEIAQKDSGMQEASLAVQVKKELEEKLKDLEKNSKFGKEELLTQLEDLQLAYSRLEQQLGRREDELKKEIEDLHKRLEHGEQRNQELSQSVSAATKPLLRQIGNLQSSYTIQSESWERVEKNLTDRLISIQDQLAVAIEKERLASEIAMEAKSKLKAVQMHQASLRDEKTNLQISLENETNKCKEIESQWKREKSSYETKLSKLKVLTMELEGEKKVLEEQLSAERIKYENDTLRMSTQLSLQQYQSQQQLQQFGNPSSCHSSRSSSVAGDIDSPSQNISMNNVPLQRYLSSSSSCHDGFHKGTTTTSAASVEHLKSQLRSREGEVYVLQEEIKGLEKTKASLAQELVNLANRVEELETSTQDLDKLKEEYTDLKSRYNAVLQMYGEKAEEADELKMDIEDVKNMYRQQIQELCGGR